MPKANNNDAALPELLKAAEALLREKVIAVCQGDDRFAGLMVASALGMAQRALHLEAECASSQRDLVALVPMPNPFPREGDALVQLLRAGTMDGVEDVHRRLIIDAILRTSITRPSFVTPHECRMAGIEVTGLD